MLAHLVVACACSGMDKQTILEKIPEAKDEIDDNYDMLVKVGQLTSLACAMAVRRNVDNLLIMGFTREEAVKIVAGGSMSAKST